MQREKPKGRIQAKKGPCSEIISSPIFKSTRERNVFRVLRHFGAIEYEPQRFVFNPPYRRCLDYQPDFIVDRGLLKEFIVEVKGWLDGPSKTRLSGFKKHYPELVKKLIVITTGKKNTEWLELNIGCQVWNYNSLREKACYLGEIWE